MRPAFASADEVNAILAACIAACPPDDGESQLCALSAALLVAARSCSVPVETVLLRLVELAPQVAAVELGPLPQAAGRRWDA